ncbi:hypothetical protein Tco_1017408 [Tanacetum coccineum]|uniref:Uncharacterized protein n=1 Tax=Tanacetum coccineum TaxID=301880 RepID=A0ABQ5FSS3_9ASTR
MVIDQLAIRFPSPPHRPGNYHPYLYLTHHPASPIRSLGYRAAMIWLRAEAASSSHHRTITPPIILSPSHTQISRHGPGAQRLMTRVRNDCAHARTARLMEAEARMSREAWQYGVCFLLVAAYGEAEGRDADELCGLNVGLGFKAQFINALKQLKRHSDPDEQRLRDRSPTKYYGRPPARIALLCGRKYLVRESDKIEKYVGGLPDMIHGSVVASKPKTIQDAVEIATELMDKKIRNFMSENFHTEIK